MSEITRSLLIFVGAGTGGLARYYTDRLVHVVASREFPFGTLLINVSGSLVIGVLFPLLAQDRYEPYRLLLLTGLLGGYTTFSAFSRETVTLIQQRQIGYAVAYVLCSVLLSLLAAGAGMKISSRVMAW